jgi:hypothetical protein
MMDRRAFIRHFAALDIGTTLCLGGMGSAAASATAADGYQVIQVGAERTIRTIAEAARLARTGSTIEVDAGVYPADVATWRAADLTLRAVGGRARLLAQGAAAEDKGIWVVRGANMRVEGFDFEGAAVADRNGAGIRLETGSLYVRDCRFLRNEMGLLTNHDPNCVLEVENCEFAHNRRPDGHNHNLYAGRIARLSVTGSYFHHAHIGHLLKSRAAVSHIYYNRLTDESGGSGSYELEFPNGGEAYVVGNLIAQSNQTQNRHLIAFGAEGLHWQRNAFYLVHNTLVNPLSWRGVFLRMARQANDLRAINNLLVGSGSLDAAGPDWLSNNFRAELGEFANPATHDFRLKLGSRLVGLATPPGRANGQSLQQKREYVHPRSTRALHTAAHNPGAMQSLAPSIVIN